MSPNPGAAVHRGGPPPPLPLGWWFWEGGGGWAGSPVADPKFSAAGRSGWPHVALGKAAQTQWWRGSDTKARARGHWPCLLFTAGVAAQSSKMEFFDLFHRSKAQHSRVCILPLFKLHLSGLFFRPVSPCYILHLNQSLWIFTCELYTTNYKCTHQGCWTHL